MILDDALLMTMLSQRLRCSAHSTPRLLRNYATPVGGPHTLLFVEHTDGSVDAASLSALMAAKDLKCRVTALGVGGEEGEISEVVEQAKRLDGIVNVLNNSSPTHKNLLPEHLALQVKSSRRSGSYIHLPAAHSTLIELLFLSIAAQPDVPAAPKVTSATSNDHRTTTFAQPIDAKSTAKLKAPSSPSVPTDVDSSAEV